MGYQSGRPVVLYTEAYHNAHVILLDGEGPKYFRGRSLHLDDNGQEVVGTEWKYEKGDYRIIAEGKRFDLVKRIREAHWRYEEERRAHDQARSRAESDARTAFRDKWLAEHPYPKWPGVESILEEAKA